MNAVARQTEMLDPIGHAADFGVRTAGLEDHEALCRVLVSAHQRHLRMLPVGFLVYAAELARLEAHLRGRQVLVAQRGERIAGMLSYFDSGASDFSWPSGWASVRGPAVAYPWQWEAVGMARGNGNPVIAGHCPAALTPALELYDALGFVRAPSFDYDAGRAGGGPCVPMLAHVARLGPSPPTLSVLR
jgi:hypothetical protein